jgi:DNA polymerase-3 subunit epsilon
MNLATVLTLTRPIAVCDLESTGVSPEQDRIVQIAITIHYPDKDPVPWTALVNPGVPIPADATAVHHITDAMVADAHPFKVMAGKLSKVLTTIDYAGFNVTFDLKMLRAEMLRSGVTWTYEGASIIDAHRIYQILDPRDLTSAYEKYVGRKRSDAHDAGVDVRDTEAVLVGQLAAAPHLPRTVAELAALCWPRPADAVDQAGKIVWRAGVACIGFGKKYNGIALKNVDKGYFKWMLAGDFPADTKRICEDALSGVYPTRG